MSKLSQECRDREEQEAVSYAHGLVDGLSHDWATWNAGIVDRLSITALVRIKTRAWRIVEGWAGDKAEAPHE